MKIVMLIVGLFVGSCTTLTVMSCLIINRYNDYESEIRRLKAKLENKDKYKHNKAVSIVPKTKDTAFCFRNG